MRILYLINHLDVNSGNGYVVANLSRHLVHQDTSVDIVVTSPQGFQRLSDEPEKPLNQRTSTSVTLENLLDASYDISHNHSPKADINIITLCERMKGNRTKIVTTAHVYYGLEFDRLFASGFSDNNPGRFSQLFSTFETMQTVNGDDLKRVLWEAFMEGVKQQFLQEFLRVTDDFLNCFFQKKCFSLSDHVIHLTDTGYENAVDFYVPELDPKIRKQTTIGNGINLVERAPPVRTPEKEVIILYSGRLSVEKGIRDLVKAFVGIVAQERHLKYFPKLHIHGGMTPDKESQDDRRIRHEIEEMTEGIRDHVEFVYFTGPYHGYTSGEDIKHYLMEKAHLFAVPSKSETFSIVVPEAMNRNLPVIASDLAVFKELYGDNIIMFAQNNEHSLRDELRKVLENPLGLVEVAHKAYQKSLEFDWHNVVDQHRALYEYVRIMK